MVDISNSIVYQVYPKSFKDSNGDGVGDLRGVIEKLDYLKSLGIDYLWLTPVFPSPQNDGGYDIANYTAIDAAMGTMEDMEELISRADKKNIGIMLDMVFNHTSSEHEWFQKALAGDKKYQDYYIFVEGDGKKPPTNWTSKFSGSTWEYVPSLGKWYFHIFDRTQPDLNWKNPEVREELKNVIRFWQKKGVKGFRFDVINLISKCDGWQDDYEGDGRRFYTDGPHVHAYIKELTRDTGLDEMITVGEMNSTSLEQCKLYANPAEKELSMCFQFHHLKVDYKDGDKWKLQRPDIPKLKEILKTWQEEMQRAGSNMAVFWDNHDQPRAVSRFGSEDKYWKESAKMLAMCIHFMRGTPYIYQGDEIGMQNPHFSSIEQYRDVESIRNYEKLLAEGNRKEDILKVLAERSRDNGRTPMQWEKNGGFTEGSPWIGYGDSVSDINVAAQENEEDSILNFYRKMVQYRKNRKIIREGEISFQDGGEKVLAYERILGREKLFVLCNFSENPSEQIVLPEEEAGWTILEDSYTECNHFPERNVLILRPYEGIVLESRQEMVKTL